MVLIDITLCQRLCHVPGKEIHSPPEALLAPDQHSKLHVAVEAGTSAQGNISPINVEERSLALVG